MLVDLYTRKVADPIEPEQDLHACAHQLQECRAQSRCCWCTLSYPSILAVAQKYADSRALSTLLLQVCGEFHSYVRPTVNQTLSKFCTTLTGISQSAVDQAPTLGEVLVQCDAWLNERGLLNTLTRRDFAFAADGPWDLKFFLDAECVSHSCTRD